MLVPEPVLPRWLGRGSGWAGIASAALLGSISLIPGFIAFPLGAILVRSGVSYQVIAVFITTLMMVGILTLPLEAKYFGWKVSILRNASEFLRGPADRPADGDFLMKNKAAVLLKKYGFVAAVRCVHCGFMV